MGLNIANPVHRSGASDMLVALVSADGSASHPHVMGGAMNSGPHATRNLADAVHYLCVLHGRHPGVVDMAALRAPDHRTREWLGHAADSFAIERALLTRLTVAAGPIPSTPGQAECESAVIAQRHALEMLSQSDRPGCALGAAAALLMDWAAIRPVLDRAADRLGLAPQPARLPALDDMLSMIDGLADTGPLDRAITFGAQQILTQHRGLWGILEARQVARGEY